MMLHAIGRGLARVALRWFYREVTVVGLEHVPMHGPLLIAQNHPNALVDALAALAVMPRRVTLTAKATLVENPLLRWLFPRVGVVPLRRASDERARRTREGAVTAAAGDARNAASFDLLIDALASGAAVLIFPEGRSHSEPQLAPLKTGLARIALQARDARGVQGIAVLPVGLTFERKWQPRSRILVHVGEPLWLDGWTPSAGGAPVAALTAVVAERLRTVTLNYESEKDEAQTRLVALTRADVFSPTRTLGRADAPLIEVAAMARRVERVRDGLGAVPAGEVADFLERIAALRRIATEHDIALADAAIDPGARAGAWFAVREGAIMALALPAVVVGTVSNRLPLTLAWWLGRRTSRNLDEPAMHTIVAGLGLVVLAYLVQGALVGVLAGWWWAALYLLLLPLTATWDLRWRDRARRARQRMRAYFLFRREPALRAELLSAVGAVRAEAEAIEGQVSAAV